MTRRRKSAQLIIPTQKGISVAVVGIGCRFPNANGPAEFWRLLSQGGDAITEVPASRYDIDVYHDPRPRTPNRIVSRLGGFLDQIDEFDAGYFGVAPREAERMDPQQRLLLEATADAIADAGLTRQQLSTVRTGVYVGGMSSTYWEMLTGAGITDLYAAAGGARSFVSGRVSFAFDLRGPSMSVDSACSSGLSALHLAFQSVRCGENALAVAGGVNLVTSPAETIPFSQAGMIAPDGRCKFGSATADGFIRSEGVAVVVLKPLAQAEADGDAIYAVIYGSAVGNDGQSEGYLMAPSRLGQEETLRAAYADAGVLPGQVDYIEAHGTGTPVGDPVELGALGAVVGAERAEQAPCLVGSVKSNIGHTEAASGLAGFIKVVLALQHRRIPPSLHATVLTDKVDWDALRLRLVPEITEWPQTGRPGLAGVSSFGISGTNAHVVVGEYRPAAPAKPAQKPVGGGTPVAELLVLSAPDLTGLAALATRYAEFLEPGGDGRDLEMRDVCFSAATRRQHHESRLTAVGASPDELAERLRAYVAGESRPLLGATAYAPVDAARPRTVFVFPGQGSQWDGMGRELLAGSPVFREMLTRCDEVIQAEAGWSLIDRLTGEDDSPASINTVQPTLWAMETALCALLRDWGVEPDYVVGHSMGEVGAACAVGALGIEDAGAVICRRSRLLKTVAGQGAMYSVELSVTDAEAALAGQKHLVSVAVSNSPTSTVISGDPEALSTIVKGLDERGIFCRQVKVDVASHSPQMDQLREELLASLGELAPRAGEIPLYSTVDDTLRDGSELDAAYWVRNLREPVRFGAAVTHLAEHGATVYVEISPHPILLPAIQECLALSGTDGTATGCLRRDEPERASMLDVVGALHRAGCPVDWGKVFGEPPPRYVRLPSYPWQRRRYWFTPAEPRSTPAAAGPAPVQRVERVVDLAREPYLRDHRVQGTVVLPGTAYLEMVHAAAARLCPGQVPVLRDVRYLGALFFPPDRTAVTLSIEFTPRGADAWDFAVTSREVAEDVGEPTVHVSGTATCEVPPEERMLRVDELRAACPEHRDGPEFYRRFAARGNEWLGAFQGIEELWAGEGQALGRIGVPPGVDPSGYICHPALLDSCGQLIASLIPAGDRSAAFVLGSVDEVVIYPGAGVPVWAHAVPDIAWRSDSVCGGLVVADGDGRVIIEIKGLRLQYLQPPESVRDPEGWFHELRWQPLPALPVEAPPGGRRLVFADRGGIGAALDADVVVYQGDGYRQVAPGRYEIDPTAPRDYRRLLADVRAEFDGLSPRDVVHLWTLDADPVDTSAPARLLAEEAERVGAASVLRLVQALSGAGLPEPPRLTLVTRGVYRVVGTDRAVAIWQAPVWGLGRVIAHEHRELRCTLVDLDAAGPAESLAVALRRELANPVPEDQLALRGDDRYAARLLPCPAEGGQSDGGVAYQLQASTPGMLDGMRMVPIPRREPGPGEVEVRADYLALNYRDVLVSMNWYPTLPGVPGIILGECAGAVSRVGPGVAGLRPGDAVVAISLDAPAATYMCVNAHLVRRRPARLTAQEAASLPLALATAWHSLITLGQLRTGERVLIHHATGGVGMAAIQLARWRGAEVYATAGNSEKRAMLRMMGIAHVYDSRSTDFAEQIREDTRGEGVDVVLNTLAGEGLLKSVGLLADRGRYLELSRRDLVEGTPLDMRLLARSASFFVVDVVDLGKSDPRRLGTIVDETLTLVQAGVLQPPPHRIFPASDLIGAFRYMAQAKHVGKVLVSTAELTVEVPEAAPAPSRPVRVDPGAGYLVTGGLGDLGRVVVDWLVREGAQHLLLTGRTPLAESGAAGWLTDLRRHGVQAVYEAVDVADEEAMRAVVHHYEQGDAPIRGVVHTAGVIDYSALSDLDARVLSDVLRPKSIGALVLGRLFAERALDFFVLFSSASGVLSSPMLGAYAAANAFLDTLAQQRRLEGRTALSVNWGFWAVGMPARAGREQSRDINPTGIDTFSPREGIEALRLLLARDATNAMVLPGDWPRWAAAHKEAADSPLLRNLLAAARIAPLAAPVSPEPAVLWPSASRVPVSPSPIRPVPVAHGLPARTVPTPTAIAPASPAAASPAAPQPNGHGSAVAASLTDWASVERYLTQVLADVLGLPPAQVHPQRPLKRQGIDSLMAVEVRSRVQRDLGTLLPITKMLGGQSVAEMADDLHAQLSGRN